MSTTFDENHWTERLAAWTKMANVGCGLSYDVFEANFCGYVASGLLLVEPENLPRALEMARAAGYYTQAELEAAQVRDLHDGSCAHGIDPDCCPAGCGDLDDGQHLEWNLDGFDPGEEVLDAMAPNS